MRGSKEGCGDVSMFLAWFAFACFCLYAASFASPVWMEGDFQIAAPSPPAPAGTQMTSELEIGLVWACTDVKTAIPALNTVISEDHDCETLHDVDTDEIEDWRWVAAGLGIGAVIAIFVAMILSCVLGSRKQRDLALRFLIALFFLVAGGTLLGAVIVVSENKDDFEIKRLGGLKVDLDYGWGFYVSAVCVGLFFLGAIINVVICFFLPSSDVFVRQSQSPNAEGEAK